MSKYFAKIFIQAMSRNSCKIIFFNKDGKWINQKLLNCLNVFKLSDIINEPFHDVSLMKIASGKKLIGEFLQRQWNKLH